MYRFLRTSVFALGMVAFVSVMMHCGDNPVPVVFDASFDGTPSPDIDGGTPGDPDYTVDAPPAQPDTFWPDQTVDYWPTPPDGYNGGGAPFGCASDLDCYGQLCCPTPWGVKMCAPTCGS
jgi:hypothetical protein